MYYYQSISDANYGNISSENWKENLWENALSPSSNTSGISTSQVSNATFQTYFDRNVVPRSQDYQVPISAACLNVESSFNLSPKSWDGAAVEIPQTCTNMSTYFSTFDPSSQFQDISLQGGPVTNISNYVKTQSVGVASNRKSHQARTNIVPSGSGNFEAIVRQKRKRTMFTTEQLQVLEEVYSEKPYVKRDERQILVQQLHVNDKSVITWFQNRRQKNKSGDDQEHADQSSIFDRLDTLESKIKAQTDEFGFVTLDDKIMSDLVNVTDDYLSNNASPVEIKTESDERPIYEPISPVSVSEDTCEENVTTWPVYEYESNDIIQEEI